MKTPVKDIVGLANEYAAWIRTVVVPIGLLKFSEIGDSLITPQGNVIPFNRRALEVQKLFNLTPLEFQKRFNSPADNALLVKGYIYVNGGIIQAGVSGSGLSPDQISLISQYFKSLPKNTEIEITLLKHDPNSFKLLEETPIYQGDVQGANDKLLNMPSQTGELAYQSMPNYQFVPQKGGVPKESPSGTGWKGQFRFPISSLKFSDIVSQRGSSKKIFVVYGRTFIGLPVIQLDSLLYAIATDSMADYAVDRGLFKLDLNEQALSYYGLTIEDLPKEVLRALGVNRGFEGNIYLYEIQ